LQFLRRSDERKNAVVDNNMDALARLRKQLDGDENDLVRSLRSRENRATAMAAKWRGTCGMLRALQLKEDG
jgi:hypothetical protein